MSHNTRVILDVENDVFRDIAINGSESLEKFHYAIAESFGFNCQEMSSFYTTDKNWNQEIEIPMFDMFDNKDSLFMQNCTVEQVLPKVGNRLIYVYDFFKLWTFFVEVKSIDDSVLNSYKILLAIGDVPENAPEKLPISDSPDITDEIDDSINGIDKYNNSEDFDDFDENNFH